MQKIWYFFVICCALYGFATTASLAETGKHAPEAQQNISLNFQDISVRAALQLIADFTDQNIIISDGVQGNISLHLDNIPWQQALDLILASKGLGMRRMGEMLLIAPHLELSKGEQLALESRQQLEHLAALHSVDIQLKYARAQELLLIIKDAQHALLSSRGQAFVDPRTNTLLINDLADNITNIKLLIKKLDIQVPQVMIETQIVEATESLSYALGLKFKGQSPNNATENKLFFDFAAADGAKLGLTLAHLPGGTALELELHASESEGKSKTIARPKLLTLDQQPATIETGTEIPYVTTAQQGATPTTIFKKAALRLEVTPKITPADKVALRIFVNNDTPGQVLNGTTEPSINTTSLTTNVLVANGQTIVLGGIFKLTNNATHTYIPYLNKIPVLGKLFSYQRGGTTRTEVLIFVTPRIVRAADANI